MPAFDTDVKSAATAFDHSAGAEQATAAVNLGRTGLMEGLSMTVVITVASTDDFSADLPKVRFEYSTDNGSTWNRGGVLELEASASGIPLQVKSTPCGPIDIDPEQHAAADIDWRAVIFTAAIVAGASDPTFQAYLTGRMGFPAEQD